jgi:MYXO-CTERM domain-containing protein
VTTAALATAASLIPTEADACGGLFCDAGPQPMPVDQTGEDILFVTSTPGKVEVHIRIQYDGDAEQFAWVIPVQSVPTEFAVGNEKLFENIKTATVPTYGFSTTQDTCGNLSGGADGAQGEGTTAPTTTSASDTAGGPDGPTIFLQTQVGAFEITVLGEGTAQEVVDWLDMNGYQQDDEALPIIQEYLQDNHLFAAIKLTGGADVDEIHPIALQFDHPEPCVPLKLTRIAAVDDMEVRTYFLSNQRVVPMNYRHVLVNPLKIDWPNQAANYKEVITGAVDEQMADGRAFVTEYAGPTSAVQNFDIDNPAWDAAAYQGTTAVEAVQQLKDQGLVLCDGFEPCQATHQLLDGIVQQHIVLDGSVTLEQLYECPECYETAIDQTMWDAAAFATMLDERIFAPAEHAVALLQQNSYLSRMYTVISPHEMTEDPMFHENPDLGDVANLRQATQTITCDGDSVWALPDGREVFVPGGETWPLFPDLPWAEEVQETPNAGAEVILVDNTDLIDERLAQYNAEVTPEEPSLVGGCGCETSPRGTAVLWSAFGLLGLLVLRRRRS